MGAVVALDRLLDGRQVWRGPARQGQASDHLASGHPALDARLPGGGWPASGLCEVLQASPGVGELALVWPALAKLSQRERPIVLIAPPHRPHAPAWAAAGLDLAQLQIIHAAPKQALWAAEQCLRSGSCAAVLCWPERADDRALRRLQVAAETGQALAFACRPQKAAHNPSPAALRIAIDTRPAQWRVLKCRGGMPPAAAIACPGRG